jgi:hypothetical protein
MVSKALIAIKGGSPIAIKGGSPFRRFDHSAQVCGVLQSR